MKKLATLKSLAEIANELDVMGLHAEANVITNVMAKVAQVADVSAKVAKMAQLSAELANQSMKDAGNSITSLGSALNNFGQSIVDVVTAVGQAGASLIEGAVSPILIPLDMASSLGTLISDDLFRPYAQQIESLENENDQLRNQIMSLAKSKDKQGILNILRRMKSNNDKQKQQLQVLSQINQRKQAGQYKGPISEFQNTIDYAVQNRLTIRQMYDYAVKNRGGNANYANNLIAKYRTVYPDPDTALVKPVKFS